MQLEVVNPRHIFPYKTKPEGIYNMAYHQNNAANTLDVKSRTLKLHSLN